MYKKINLDHCYFVVDVDIKGFFDNVNHSKLMKQLWTIGIRDKKVLCIIGKMLKSEIEKEGIPDKGIPQGGIISPLLDNVVLNELDWWLSNQWETFETNHQYSQNYTKYKELKRTSKLKEIYFVRYADDFKIFCKYFITANKIFQATKQWLLERLKLEISPDKSIITDVRKSGSEFLGIIIKAKQKNHKWIVTSKMTDKAKENAINIIREQIYYMQKNKPNPMTVYILNRLIVGLQNYYKIATEVNNDFSEIDYKLSNCLKHRLRSLKTKTGCISNEYNKRYAHYGGKKIFILKHIMYPINAISTTPPKFM